MSRHSSDGFLSTIQRYRSLLISVVIIGLLALVLYPQAETLRRSLDSLRQASLIHVLMALFMTLVTYALSAEIYHLLLKHPVRLRTVFIVQLATALTARIVPVGVGTMGLNAIFLRRHKHSLAESLAVVTANNSLGIVGHTLLLAIVATTAPLPDRPGPSFTWDWLYWMLIAIVISVALFSWSDKLWRKIQHTARGIVKALAGYRHHLRDLGLALITSMSLTIVYSLILLASCQALGITLPLNQIFIVFTLSLLAGSLTPTPGGLVGVEAGVVTGLIAYGVPADTALAVALLYRLVTYWLPLLPGLLAFRVVQKHYL